MERGNSRGSFMRKKRAVAVVSRNGIRKVSDVGKLVPGRAVAAKLPRA